MTSYPSPLLATAEVCRATQLSSSTFEAALTAKQRVRNNPWGWGVVCAGLERHGQSVDFYQHHLMGQVNEDGGPAGHGPAGDILLYEFCVDLVHGVEVLAAGQIDAEHQHVLDRRMAGSQDRFDVLQRSAGLCPDVS